MAGDRSRGVPDNELFMNADGGTLPSVGPLRINKPQSPSGSATSPAPFSPPLNPAYGAPTTNPPTRPLPYPDDRARPQDSDRYSPYSPNGSHPGPIANAQKPLPPSPGPSVPDQNTMSNDRYTYPIPELDAGPSAPQHFYPPPGSISTMDSLRIPNAGGVNRLASTASVSTTKAARGSPPPPETPADDQPASGGIEARYAASGLAGAETLDHIRAQKLASQQRRQQYEFSPPPPQPQATYDLRGSSVSPPQQQQPRPPIPNQSPSQAGPNEQTSNVSPTEARDPRIHPAHDTPIEQDMQNMHINEEAPPAYSSVGPPRSQTWQHEKMPVPANDPRLNNQGSASAAGPAAGAAAASAAEQYETQSQPTAQPIHASAAAETLHQPQPISHPGGMPQGQQPNQQQFQGQVGDVNQEHPSQSGSPAPSRVSPPPLPEGWIAHIDPASGQYYYIHLATHSTQWEFPKGPTPLNLNDQPPLSPTGTLVSNPLGSPASSTFVGKPLTSPGFLPSTMPGRESMVTLTSVTSPTAAGFVQPPPSAGVEIYRIQPTNGVYFGPYLRYTNMDVDNGVWYGSIMLVTDATHPPTIHIHQSVDLSPNPRQLKANHIFTHARWMFFRYDIDLKMEDDRESRWTYAITSHLGCTRYEFLVASRTETSWRFIAHSGNDFDVNVSANERQKLGGVGYMWRDILQKHVEVGGFHTQLGMGNQICADRMWKEIPSLRQWTAISGKDNRRNFPWTAQHEDDVSQAYFHYYTSHYDQPHLREAFAQIPYVCTLDDHEIFDGFGSYPEALQFSSMFKNIGRLGITFFLLFQHHTTLEILNATAQQRSSSELDLFTITGKGWHFIKYLGPAVVIVGPDCRSERTPYQVLAGPTYQGLFPKIALLPPHVQHCIWMIPVPVIYPRLETAAQFAQTMATGKKAVTGTFNALGKITSGVAGIVGAKGVVNESFVSVKKAVGKTGLMSSVLSPFGELDIMDELRDMWTHESKDLERTYLIRTLQTISSSKALRMTFFSGAANCCGAGLVSDPSSPGGHKTMYQIISSPVVNAPPSSYALKLLQPHGGNPQRPLYIPANGHRSRPDGGPVTDTKEDMLDVFAADVNGQQRETRRLMGRRNYVAVVSYDPEAVHEAFSVASGAGSVAGSAARDSGHVNLAIDFFVQTDSGQMQAAMNGMAPVAATVKYGPLTIPALQPGH